MSLCEHKIMRLNVDKIKSWKLQLSPTEAAISQPYHPSEADHPLRSWNMTGKF